MAKKRDKTYLLNLLREKNVSFKNIILSQDAFMQNGMDAILRKYIPDDIKIINGPKGKNFIVHVDIPENVKAAFEELKSVYGNKIREVHRLNSVSYMANLS